MQTGMRVEKKEVARDHTRDRTPFPFQCKALPNKEDDDFFFFEGYLSTYGNVDKGSDVILKGCFDESLKELWPDLRWQHRWDDVIGIFEDIKSDDKGLFVEGKMPKADDLVRGRVIPQMQVGSVKAMSIGYWAQEFDYDENGVRIIRKAMLFEGSLVSQPMNELAEVTGMKTFDISDVENIQTKRDIERLLRDSGAFSNRCCVYLASKFNFGEQSDSASKKGLSALVNELNNLTSTIKNI